jgi:hypothetical protein
MLNILGIHSSKKGDLVPKLQRIETVRSDKKGGGFGDNLDTYLKIDKKNNLSQMDEDELENLEEKFKEFKEKETKIFESTNKTLNKFFEKFSSRCDNIFLLSVNISKNLKVGATEVEKHINSLIGNGKNNFYKKNELILNKYTCTNIGGILAYCFPRFDRYKIKDIDSLISLRNLILKNKNNIDIYKDFLDYCNSKNLDINEEKKIEFCKKNRKKYENIPELAFIINRYANVTSVILEIDSFFSQSIKEEDFHLIELAILNIYWLLNSLVNVKFNFISKYLQQLILARMNEKIYDVYRIFKEDTKKNNALQIKIFQNKWNFIDFFKIRENREILNNISNTISHKSFDLSNNKKEKVVPSNTFIDMTKTSLVAVVDFLNPFANKKDEAAPIKTRLDIVKNNLNIFDLMIICLFSLNNCKNKINFELIMNDNYLSEFVLIFNKVYQMEWIQRSYESFNIFDLLLYNSIIKNIQQFNIEINTLDPVAFDKLLNFLYYNNTLTSFNFSVFSADISYFPQFLYKILEGLYNDNVIKKIKEVDNSTMFLFTDATDTEEKILAHLSDFFIYNLGTLFEIIKKKKQFKELGFNFDAPSNIVNKPDYMDAILKFILNLIYYVSNSRIQQFCLISPSTVIDCRVNPAINNLIKGINFDDNKSLEVLSLQAQFYKIEYINNFVNANLKILNIGDLDIYTLKMLSEYICTDDFNRSSSLESLSIGLSGALTYFNTDLKIIFEKLFRIKIQNLTKLNIYTNIFISDKFQYFYLLKILDCNWISEYNITFNFNSKNLLFENKNKLNDLQFLVPHHLEGKLLVDEDLVKIKDKSFIEKIDKNEDMLDEAYWCLKHIFDHVHVDKITNGERTKFIIYNILKYIYFIKPPKVNHFSIKNQ